jgi:hypothetical protein
MSNRRWLLALATCACAMLFVHSLEAMTLDYSTTARALAEAGWIDQYFGDLMAIPVEDSKEATGGRSYAEAYWDEVKYAGKLSIDIAASAKAEPNLITLTTDLSGSFRREAGTPLFTYFYQWAQGTLEAKVQIDEFSPGTPCSLHFDVNWPQDTWTGDYYWRLEAASSVEWMECGYDPNGPYGPRSGSVTTIAGEPVSLSLATLGEGLYQIGASDALGLGRIQLDVKLTVTKHVADLYPDDVINFKDFAVFARQWRRDDPGSAEAAQRAANFDGSGIIDIGDLQWLAYSWLLSPRPPAAGGVSQ